MRFLIAYFFLFLSGNILSQDIYIYGENDSKYRGQVRVLENMIQVRSVSSAGHRCCFEQPETIKSIINELYS